MKLKKKKKKNDAVTVATVTYEVCVGRLHGNCHLVGEMKMWRG